jgi:RNA polymerase sigma factor (sigma-70 family)
MSPPPAENFAARIFIGPALRAQPDRRLVDLVRDGYDAAFEEIVRRYRRPLDRFAAAIVGGRSEDVTQDAFSKALLALRGTEAEIELRPWLYRIVRNTALNDLRDRAPEAAELSEALPGGRSAAAEAEAREELAELMERLRALPEPQRAALVMRELEGLGHEEIAAALGVSGGAARQAIYRARAALRAGFGLLLPMPVMRALAEHGDAATNGAIAAGAGASTAGGAALGGLGGGAVKAGVATLLVAGAVGAGVAVDNQQGERAGPEPAEAAAPAERPDSSPTSGAEGGSGPGGSASDSSGPGRGGEDRRGEDEDEGHGNGRDDADEGRGGSERGSRRAGSRQVSDDDRGSNSGPGSISSGRGSGDDDGDADHSGPGSGDDLDANSGSGSGSSGSGGDSGSSGSGSGSGESGSGSSGGDGESSGPGSGEVEPEPETDPVVKEEPVEDNSGSGSEDSGSGSGELDGLGQPPGRTSITA